MDFNAQLDFSLFDGAEDVNYIRVTAGGQTVIPIVGALRRNPVRNGAELLPPGVALTSTDAVWHLPMAALDSVTPTAGDMITTGTETWIVLAASQSPLTARWRVVARLGR